MIRYSSLHGNLMAFGRSLSEETAAGMTVMSSSFDNRIKLFICCPCICKSERTNMGGEAKMGYFADTHLNVSSEMQVLVGPGWLL